ncbi:MAG: hypothetical protein KIT10_00990 [Flavobacteriales bacterium]|nr:hypothetical protein [Flavobacteriales bacterium]
MAATLGQAQTLERRAAVSAGGHGEGSGASLGWTLGQTASATYEASSEMITAGVQQPDRVFLSLDIRVLLDGPYQQSNSLMSDGLRLAGLIPFNEPYSDLGYQGIGGGGESFPSGILVLDGPDAIVDWVWIELRDALHPAHVVSARAALVQRDGDVVDRDGSSAIGMSALPGEYHVAVHHRNHLPVMTAAPVALGWAVTPLDLSTGMIDTYGLDAQRLRGGRWLLWAGDVTGNGVVQYTGPGNDRDPILQAIGGLVPSATTSGYMPHDVNLDGTVKYTGQDNDRDPILQTIGGTVPTNVRMGQLP